MITLKSTSTSNFPIPETHYDLLDEIPTRDYTDWLELPQDPDNVVEPIKAFVQERAGSWDKIIAIGMGGSALGITTLQRAFFPFDDKLTVLDNLDSNTIHHLLLNLDPERTLVMVISKSGGTLETMTNYYVLKEKFSEEQYQKNFIAITDPKKGFLRELATRNQLTSFPIPSMVGGRFSVLTALGLLPLALLGGDIDQLLEGAKDMLSQCELKNENNPAMQLANIAFELSKQGKNITSMISYSDQFYSLGLWYQQLLAESIGKNIKVGLTPLALRGASDQHSVLQLLQEGPNDKLNIFLDLVKPIIDVKVPHISDEKFAVLNNNPDRTVHEILRIECHGTEQALREDQRPTVMIEIAEVSEYAMGQLFQLFEMQIAILGELYQINAYNQPGVEKSKKLVKALING